MEEILLAQEDSKKKELGTEARMEAQPLKEALPEGGTPSINCQAECTNKLIGWPEGTSAATVVAMVAKTAQP
jgi:hypothetical protein